MSLREPRFGTDGVRGVANAELSPQLALKLGMAAAYVLAQHSEAPATGRTVVVGRDTRISGDVLEAALSAGLASLGATVIQVGVAPTPGVSQITRLANAAAGAVISASHNPFHDNGIKFFGPNGRKLSDDVEDEIEAAMSRWEAIPRPDGDQIGRIRSEPAWIAGYIRRVEATAGGRLEGMNLVLDCANGAAHDIAPRLFRELGAEVAAIHTEPDGVNINVRCGSTHPASLCAEVQRLGAHAGIAFDGDCDRVMMCDERGAVVDGDRMMAICALGLQRRGELTNDVVIATIMSNAGLEVALERHGIRLDRTDVGDRCVAAEMERTDAAVGGEQSGHLLFPHLAPTGDGMVTALQVLGEMRDTGRPLSELASLVQTCPQLLRNVRVKDRESWKASPEIQQAIESARASLGKPDWLSVRASGTEPLIRVMVQDTDAARVESTVAHLVDLIERNCGAQR